MESPTTRPTPGASGNGSGQQRPLNPSPLPIERLARLRRLAASSRAEDLRAAVVPYQSGNRMTALSSHPAQFGYLSAGVHDHTLSALMPNLVTSKRRAEMWKRLNTFLRWPSSSGAFTYAYLGGGYISGKKDPSDIDVVLQTRDPFGPQAFRAIEPFFAFGLETIEEVFSVHLHFWIEGSQSTCDFRAFFQYYRTSEAKQLGLQESARKGIVRIKLPIET